MPTSAFDEAEQGREATMYDNMRPKWAHPLGSGLAIVTSCYGPRKLHGNDGMHRGLDLRGAKHTLVFAMAEGRVRRAGRDPKGWGRFVEVDHGDGWSTLYAHLDGLEVRSGQSVKAGDTVGFVGNTGRAFGDHLHLEVSFRGRRYNPLGALLCSDRGEAIQFKEACPRPPPLCRSTSP